MFLIRTVSIFVAAFFLFFRNGALLYGNDGRVTSDSDMPSKIERITITYSRYKKLLLSSVVSITIMIDDSIKMIIPTSCYFFWSEHLSGALQETILCSNSSICVRRV